MTTITYGQSVFAGNAKTRRHERRRAAAIERDNIGNIIDTVFGISAPEASEEPGITGCKNRVEQALRAPNWREPKETAFVTLECQEYRKVRNPDGQQVNARQKMRGKSIPLI